MAAFGLAVLARTFRVPAGTLAASGWAQLVSWGGPKIFLILHACSAALARAATIALAQHTRI
eukprot:9166210-Pyramimonas_sp.AAC.1